MVAMVRRLSLLVPVGAVVVVVTTMSFVCGRRVRSSGGTDVVVPMS